MSWNSIAKNVGSSDPNCQCISMASGVFRPFASLGSVSLYRVAPLVLAILACVQFPWAAQQPARSPGKLYVLDSNYAKLTSAALVVDLEKREVTKTYPAGFHPDMALSADGRRLYLAYDAVNSERKEQKGAWDVKGVLDVIDTATGNLIAHVDNPNRWWAISELNDSTMALSLYDSTMALSKDGRWLFVSKVSKDGAFYGLAVFDTTTDQFLPDTISLPMCEAALLRPSKRVGNTLFVVCKGTKDVRTARLTPKGSPVANDLPHGFSFARNGAVKTAFQSEADLIRVVMQDGQYSTLDMAAHSMVGRGALAGTPANPGDGGETGRIVQFSQSSTDKVFLGLLGAEHRNRLLFDEIAIVNASTLAGTSTLQASAPLWAFAVGNGGTRLYGLDPRGGSVHVFDTTEAVETEIIRGVGKSPTIVIFSQ